MHVISPSHRYEVTSDVVADGDVYRLYLCRQESTGRQCLLQIATEFKHNAVLERNAFLLSDLKARADVLDELYERVRTNAQRKLHYDLLFPELVDGFILHDQDERRINILALRNTDDIISGTIPLISITETDRCRVDLKTSVWIMGRLLKLLGFTNDEGIEVGQITSNNILIESKGHHNLIVFDWADARIYPDGVPAQIRRQEIAQAAQAVITVLGGDLVTGIIPNDGEEGFDQYTQYLLRLAQGEECSAQKAHGEFYGLIERLWPRGYHPFTCYHLD